MRKILVDREIEVDLACEEVFNNDRVVEPYIEAKKKYKTLIAEILKELDVEFAQSAFPNPGYDFVIQGVNPPILI